jgi:hypothetical protein
MLCLQAMTNKKPGSLALIILLNLLPIWGVWQWGWTPFMAFYLFWIETLIIAFFNTIKILFCRGDEYDQHLEASKHKYADIHTNFGSHIRQALGYLFVRLFIFFFYLIFIVVFIGFLTSGPGSGQGVLETMFFFNKTFNYALLGFVLNQAIDLIFNFILNDEYKKTHPSDFAAIFDGRQVIIHVAVVIGGVFSGFFDKFTASSEHKHMITSLFVISVFCLVKVIYEVLKYKGIAMIKGMRVEKSPSIG